MKQAPPQDFQVHGLFAHRWRGRESSLRAFHRHNEIEANFLFKGRLTYSIAGRYASLNPRTLYIFWGGFPHRISEWEPGGDVVSLSIPLTMFLSWNLPRETFVFPLLNGRILHETDAQRAEHDAELMSRWYDDLHDKAEGASGQHRNALLLEIHARLLRMSMHAASVPTAAGAASEPGRIGKMLQHIAEHYREPELSVQQIADYARTNKTYAMEAFKKTCGASIMQYVNEQRISNAQLMLATTDSKVLEVAMDSGFGSLSQFHDVFRKITGKTPREYSRTNKA